MTRTIGEVLDREFEGRPERMGKELPQSRILVEADGVFPSLVGLSWGEIVGSRWSLLPFLPFVSRIRVEVEASIDDYQHGE